LSEFKVKVKISIADENNRGFLGIGIVWLLEEIDKTGSIKKAAANMHMSYSKAHKILTRVEEKTGKLLLKKTRGGIERGGSELTDYAKKLIKEYKTFQNNIKNYVQEQFQKKIKDIM
jgi:molybdate transport system regulatory protein